MSTAVILLAAGSGSRIRNRRPKQLLPLKGKPLYFRSLSVFLKIPSVRELILVVPPGQEKKYKTQVGGLKGSQKVKIVKGGRFRGQSVRNGFQVCSAKMSTILIHDSARPLVSPQVVKRVEAAAKKYGVSLAAWPLPDTLKLAGLSQKVKKTIPRKNLWLAQTPQGFRMSIAKKVLLKPSPKATDDTELAERKGYKVKIVLGESKNFKVTYPFDLKTAEALLRNKR